MKRSLLGLSLWLGSSSLAQPTVRELPLQAIEFAEALHICYADYASALSRSAAVKSITYTSEDGAGRYRLVFTAAPDRFAGRRESAELLMDLSYPKPEPDFHGGRGHDQQDEVKVTCHPAHFFDGASSPRLFAE